MDTSGFPRDAPLLPHDPAIHIRHGAYLPHWTGEHGTYAVTFRLGDSLPQSVLTKWDDERKDILGATRSQGHEPSQSELRRMEKFRSSRIQAHLDARYGACHLRDERVAGCVAEPPHFFDETRYTLRAWVIMSNHIHVILTPIPPNELPDILHTWKSYTTKFANKTLERHRTFWQPEYYGPLIILNMKECAHGVHCIRENPVKAGLEDWPWVWVKSSAGILPVMRCTGRHGPARAGRPWYLWRIQTQRKWHGCDETDFRVDVVRRRRGDGG